MNRLRTLLIALAFLTAGSALPAQAENWAARTYSKISRHPNHCGRNVNNYNYSANQYYGRPYYQPNYSYSYGQNPGYPYSNYRYYNGITDRGYAPGFGSSIFYGNKARAGGYSTFGHRR